MYPAGDDPQGGRGRPLKKSNKRWGKNEENFTRRRGRHQGDQKISCSESLGKAKKKEKRQQRGGGVFDPGTKRPTPPPSQATKKLSNRRKKRKMEEKGKKRKEKPLYSYLFWSRPKAFGTGGEKKT